MRKKCALIVDDSKTARELLAKRLSAYDIDIVKVDSAANAIDYLYTHTPDAVFMDYEMPGMDGFQALRVIKSNPDTATIPIMMYTSKEDSLALGEARALGAIGVLPKQIKSQDLDAVIEQLHLLPQQISLVEAYHEPGEQSRNSRDRRLPAQTEVSVQYQDEAIPKQEETLEYAGEVYDESRFLLKRQTRMLQKELTAAEQRLTERLTKAFSNLRDDFYTTESRIRELTASAKGGRGGSVFINLLALLGILGLWWQLNDLSQSTVISAPGDGLRSELTALNGRIDKLEGHLIEGGSGLQKPGSGQAQDVKQSTAADNTIEMLSWAANRGTQFEYGENPYDDLRVVWLSELVQQLKNAGFRGILNLQAHYGDFCLARSRSGSLVVADEKLPVSECLFSSETEAKGFAQSSYQTLAFANLVNSLSADEGAPIEVFVEEDIQEGSVPPYPEPYSIKTAGEWNRIAARNQRIQVNLYRESE